MKKTLTDKIEILAKADIENGVTIECIKADIDKYAEQERYEICEGLKRAIDNNQQNI